MYREELKNQRQFEKDDGSLRKDDNMEDASSDMESRTTGALERCYDQDRAFVKVEGVMRVDESVIPDFAQLGQFANEKHGILTSIEPLGGCNGAVRGQTAAGDKFIHKRAERDGGSRIMANEFAALKFFGSYFRHQGVGRVPTCCIGARSLVCRWVDGLKQPERLMSRFFLVSVLAGHYDTGTKGNTGFVDLGDSISDEYSRYVPYFIDLGDSFAHSASGSYKDTQHYCETLKVKDTCQADDRKCFCATWGQIPYQLLDFRNGIGQGGWERGPEYFAHLNGAGIFEQWKKVQASLRKAITRAFETQQQVWSSADKQYVKETLESEIKETVWARFQVMQYWFEGNHSKLVGEEITSFLSGDLMNKPLYHDNKALQVKTTYEQACDYLRTITPITF